MIKVKKILKDIFIERFYKKFNNDKEVLNLYVEFIVFGIMFMYIEWFNIDLKFFLEDLVKIVSNIVFKGINLILFF